MILEKDKKHRFIIFASGEGSNALNLIKYFKSKSDCECPLLISDKKDAPVLKKAQKEKVLTKLIEKKSLTRIQHEELIEKEIEDLNFDYLLLCGYMRIFSKDFTKKYERKIINIHPSLLPLFPGLSAYEKAYEKNVQTHGCSVHYVDEGIDTGEIILQKSYKRLSNESFSSFKERGLALEHGLYIEALEKLIQKESSYE